MAKNKKEGNKGENLIYEASFHLVPILTEELVEGEFQSLKKAFEKTRATILSDGEPRKQALAYSIPGSTGDGKKDFTESFFGWIKFEIKPSDLGEIESLLKSKGPIMRYLIVKTVREDVVPSQIIKESKAEDKDVKSGDVDEKEKEEKKPLTEGDKEKIDKAIDEMVVSE